MSNTGHGGAEDVQLKTPFGTVQFRCSRKSQVIRVTQRLILIQFSTANASSRYLCMPTLHPPKKNLCKPLVARGSEETRIQEPKKSVSITTRTLTYSFSSCQVPELFLKHSFVLACESRVFFVVINLLNHLLGRFSESEFTNWYIPILSSHVEIQLL